MLVVGVSRFWDVSPELDSAPEVIELLSQRGIVCSIAHTRATMKHGQIAVDAGARLVTHLFDVFELPEDKGTGVYPHGLVDYLLIEESRDVRNHRRWNTRARHTGGEGISVQTARQVGVCDRQQFWSGVAIRSVRGGGQLGSSADRWSKQWRPDGGSRHGSGRERTHTPRCISQHDPPLQQEHGGCQQGHIPQSCPLDGSEQGRDRAPDAMPT